MNIVLVGCGKIGSTLTKALLKENHNIIVIDSDEKVIDNVINSYDVIAICGNGTSYDVLAQANVNKCDLFIAMTGSDEFNMLSSFIAKKMGAKHTVARIRDSKYTTPDFDYIKQNLDISLTVNPELMTAQFMYNILKLPSAISVEKFSSGDLEIVGLIIKHGQPIIGHALYELRKKYNLNFLICAVQRNDEVFIPNGSFTLQEGDKIGVITSYVDAHKLLKFFGFEKIHVKDVMIIGASKTAYYLTKSLIASNNFVTVVDKDLKRCEAFLEEINGGITAVCGNAMKQDLLMENGLSTTDAFVALTGQDEQNILMALNAIDKKCDKVIAKINNEDLNSISNKIGIDCIISPKEVVTNTLIKYARALQNSEGSKIETLYSIMNGSAEAVEFVVLEDFKYANIPLKDLILTKNTLIAGIIREGKNIIPGGDDVILPNDRVIIIASNSSVNDLSEIIRKK